MCRAAHEPGGPRRCPGCSSPAKARQRQRLSRARRGLRAAEASGNPAAIAAARTKLDIVERNAGITKATAATAVTAGPIGVPTATPGEPALPAPEPVSTEQRIRDAVRSLNSEPGEFVRISKVRELVGGDVDADEVTRVLLDMSVTDPDVVLANSANQKGLTAEDRDGAVAIGSEDKHLIAIEPPYIPGAADHVKAIGVANATDQELENGLYAPEVRSELADAIRAEQRRRKQRAQQPPSELAQTASIAAAEPSATVEQQVEAAVRDAYHAVLADRESGAEWVTLSDLRDRLPSDFSRADVDRVLDKMIESPDVTLQGELNRKTLTLQREEAAVIIGDEPRHLIKIGDKAFERQESMRALEGRIRGAVQELATRPRQFVSITKVRALLGDDVDQDAVSQTLLEMARRGDGVHLSPDSNRRGLTQADRDAAVQMGREPKHLIAIEPAAASR